MTEANHMVHGLLEQLQRHAIRLWLDGDTLRFRAPAGALTPELRAQVAAAKPALIAALRRSALETDTADSPIAADSEGACLSPGQRQMWLTQQAQPGGISYLVPFAARFRGPLDVECMRAAFQALVQRHHILRTTYDDSFDLPHQVVQPAEPWALPVIEVDQALLDDALRSALLRPFDLTRERPLRTSLYREAKDSHVLLVVQHHICTDAWSLEILVREVAELYAARSAARAPQLTPLSLQYRDYARWEAQPLHRARAQAHLAHWREQLAELPQLELATDRPRPALPSHRGEVVQFEIAAPVLTSLQRLARANDVTLFVALLSAFQLLLYRLTGQSDFGIGVPVANRARPEFERLIGLFVNTVVVRASLAGPPSFAQLMQRVRQQMLEAYAHQDLAFDELVEQIAPRRDRSRHPLFDCMFVFQEASLQLPDFDPRLKASVVRLPAESAKFDLTLTMGARGDTLVGALEYATDLFDRTTIERMVRQLESVLRSVVEHPDANCARVALLSEADRAASLRFNATTLDYARDQSVQALFAARARETPDAVAVLWRERSVSYADLDQWSNRIAHWCVSHGLGTGSLVAVMLPASPELVAAMLGILKAGAAYMPLDPAYPTLRIAGMLGAAEAAAIVFSRAVAAPMASERGASEPLQLDLDAAEIARYPAEPLACGSSPADAAYVIFTSGSTGGPKGAAVCQRGLANLCAWYRRALQIDAADRFLLLSSPSFDLTQKNIFAPLIAGAALVVPRQAEYDLDGLRLDVHEHLVSVVNCTPTAFYPLVEQGGLQDCPRLRHVVLGGESIDVSRINAWRPACAELAIWNTYGPTECSDVVSFDRSAMPLRHGNVIGRPIANVQLYVVDAELSELPCGAVGELLIGGECVGLGYWRSPDSTSLRFVDHPQFGRVYRTGDRVRLRPDLRLEFLGRCDDQLKIRGYRIELGEIEAVLRQQPAVRAAAVAAHGSGDGAYLAGYVVAEEARALEPLALRATLAERLPQYMLPRGIVVLPRLPLTPSGKIDRKALPELQPQQLQMSPLATPTQQGLAQLWSNLLGVEVIGPDDEFFVLGGNSIVGTRLIAGVRERFGVTLRLRDVFEASTLARLAERIDAAPAAPALDTREGTTAAAAHVSPVADAAVQAEPVRQGPMSFAQCRLWFMDRWAPDSCRYNVPLALAIDGALDVAALRGALDALARRHEILRTRFKQVSGELLQLIDAWTPVPCPVSDLAASDALETVRSERAREAERPFDLEREAAWRCRLLRSSPSSHVLLITMHHIITDDWSTHVFVRELAQAYQMRQSNGAPQAELPEAHQYLDYTLQQRQWVGGPECANDLAYWTQQLRDLPATLRLPRDRPAQIDSSHAGDAVSFSLSPALCASIVELAESQACTVFVALLAAFGAFLYRITGERDISLGAPFANRDGVETQALLGLVSNMLVLRQRFAPQLCYRDLLARARRTVLDALEHQRLPFEQLIEVVHPERERDRVPLFDVAFAMMNAPVGDMHLGDLSLRALQFETRSAKFPWLLTITEDCGRIGGSLEYSSALFERRSVERLVERFVGLLERMVAEPARPLAQHALLTTSESEARIERWNRHDTGDSEGGQRAIGV